jgi:hypothetical protein
MIGTRSILVRGLALVPVVLVAIAWPMSFFINAGVGIANPVVSSLGPGTARDDTMFEATLVRGGLLLIFDGTRTDNIFYDGNTGHASTGWPLYLLLVQRCDGPVVGVPRIVHPATWCGPYVIVPWWVVAVPALVLAWFSARFGRRTRAASGA